MPLAYNMTQQTPAISKPCRREWIALAALLVALAAVGLRPSIRGIDGVGNYAYVGSLLAGGDLDFGNEYREFGRMQNLPIAEAAGPVSPKTGLIANRFGVGSSIMWSPFVIAAHCALKALGRPADGVSRAYEWAVAIATLFWSAFGLMLLYGRLRRDFEAFCAGCAVIGLVLATPLGFYMYAHGSMSHGVSFFAMVVSVLAVERAWAKPSMAMMALVGVALALVVEIRFQDASWAIVLAVALAIKQRRFCIYEWAALALAGFIVFIPQLAAWKVLYGSWFSGPLPYLNSAAGGFSPWPRHALDALFSSNHGALAWHPLIAIGLGGLAMSLKKPYRALAWTGLIGFAVQAWLVGSWSVWWAGASFGNRFFISALPLVAFGVARISNEKNKRFKMILLALLCAWNMGLLVQYATQMIPREEAVPWSQIVKQNVVDVPRRLLRLP
ncbi:hypothetical protein LLG95_15895 [bacterium]|nr:hypothetical protein [bacterium]